MNAPTTSSTFEQNPWLQAHLKLGISLMDHLFNRLDGAYPNRWRAAFPNEHAIANWRDSWAEAFADEGLSPDSIATALKACRKLYDWPPSLTEFMKACKPPINLDAAIYEAVEQMRARQHGKDVWTNPAIYWAAVKVGEFDILSQAHSQLKPRFAGALEAVLAQEVIHSAPERLLALPDAGKAITSKEEGRKQLERLGALGILNRPGRINIDWAYKILDRQKGGEKIIGNAVEVAERAIANVGAAA
jgi:hypothetical protein